MYLTSKASFKDTLLIGMHQGEPPPCAPGFFILHVRRIYIYIYIYIFFFFLGGGGLVFFGVHVTHRLLCQTDAINTIFQPFIGYLCEGTGGFKYYC